VCLTVEHFCICGVAARTQRISCIASRQRPETHVVQELFMVLPREEWNARQGACPQKACPQNGTWTSDVDLVKCPGCSTLCGGAKWTNGFEGFQKELVKELEQELSDVDDERSESNDPSDFHKKQVRQLGIELVNMDFELDVNRAVFLDRALWDSHVCPVECCHFNTDSTARADEKLAATVAEMHRVAEWTLEDDEQILDLSFHGADDELIANVISREAAEVHQRLAHLRMLS
jgi:hypothetical protein